MIKFVIYRLNSIFSRSLGALHYIRIWHNNLAYHDFASWFLSKLIIKDIQTGEKYEFICNKWLAVEFGDGEVRECLNGETLKTILFQSHFKASVLNDSIYFFSSNQD